MIPSLIKKRPVLLILVLFNIALVSSLFFMREKIDSVAETTAQPLPVFGQIPSFTLKNQTGDIFTPQNLSGRVWIGSFMFTRCPGQCPAMNAKLKMLSSLLAQDIHIVSFSVDPEYDNPERLLVYATQIAAGPRWHFLTGEKKEIDKVLDGCHFGRADDPSLHGLKLVLVDEEGRVRAYYDYDNNKLSQLIKNDIKSLKLKG